jgi:hypothetical protein
MTGSKSETEHKRRLQLRSFARQEPIFDLPFNNEGSRAVRFS